MGKLRLYSLELLEAENKQTKKVRVFINNQKLQIETNNPDFLEQVKPYFVNLKYIFLWFLCNPCCDTSGLVLEIPEPFQLPCQAQMHCLNCNKETDIEIKQEELIEEEKQLISQAFEIVTDGYNRYQKVINYMQKQKRIPDGAVKQALEIVSSAFGIPEDKLKVVGVAPSGEKETIQLPESGGIQKKLGQVMDFYLASTDANILQENRAVTSFEQKAVSIGRRCVNCGIDNWSILKSNSFNSVIQCFNCRHIEPHIFHKGVEKRW